MQSWAVLFFSKKEPADKDWVYEKPWLTDSSLTLKEMDKEPTLNCLFFAGSFEEIGPFFEIFQRA
jgi:hypothetical protein